ncbi:MAG: MFS transporter [Sphingomonadales bacterium]
MVRLLVPFTALFASAVFLLAGNGGLFVLLPLRAELDGFSDLALGLMGACYFAGFIGGCFATPWLLRRAAHVRSFAALASLISVVVLMFPLSESPLLWWLARAASGFCLAGLYMTVESWLNGETANEFRGRVFAVYGTLNLAIIGIGTIAIGFGDPAGDRLFSIIAILFSLAVLPLLLTTGTTPAQPQRVRLDLLVLFRLAPVGAAGVMATGFANGAFWSLAPVFATGLGLSSQNAAIFMALACLGAAAAQWPWGRFSDGIDRRRVVLLLASLAALSASALFLLPLAPWSLALLALGFGAVAIPVNAISIAHVNDHVGSGDSVAVAGGLNLLYGIGAVVGPLLAAVLMTLVGPQGLFLLIALTHASLAGFVLFRIPRRAPVAQEDKGQFMPVSNTTQAAYDLDPRFEEAADAGGQDTSGQDQGVNPPPV